MKRKTGDALTAAIIAGLIGFLVVASIDGISEQKSEIWLIGSVSISLVCVVSALAVLYSDHYISPERFKKREEGTLQDFITEYKSSFKTKIAIAILLIISIFILFGFSVTVGQHWTDMAGAFEIIWRHLCGIQVGPEDPTFYADIQIWDVFMPRALCTIISGATLAIGGAAMQVSVKNPLADPYTTGISSGAVFGVAVASILGFVIIGSGGYGVVINAFVFALVPAFIMIAISKMSNGSVATIVLVGIAMSYIFASITTILMMSADQDTMDQVFVWQVGSLVGITWNQIPILTIITFSCSAVLFVLAGKMNIMLLGDNEARSMGLNIERFRLLLLLIVTLMTACIISFTGIIGFLGLLSPHIVRVFAGNDNRVVLPLAAIFGASFLMFADVVSRCLIGGEMPVGVVMSFIGGPLFLLLIVRSKRGAWT